MFSQKMSFKINTLLYGISLSGDQSKETGEDGSTKEGELRSFRGLLYPGESSYGVYSSQRKRATSDEYLHDVCFALQGDPQSDGQTDRPKRSTQKLSAED